MPADRPVAHNRWDLLDAWPPAPPAVSVVVVHYEQHAQLERTMRALDRQTLPPLEVVVSDDGSDPPPTLPAPGSRVRVLTQPDEGFRAARARNRGAAACRGDQLVFLDADTVPGPDFLRQVTRRTAQLRDAVAVGRRHHADLRGLPPDTDPSEASALDDPAWLEEGYRATRNLLDADGRSFRFVISAALAVPAVYFEELGGFDERFVGYGGEDWDLAYRAWNSGGVLVHEREAVAWHDGPEWAARTGTDPGHEAQTARLASLIPEPSTRGAPLPLHLPDVLVDVDPHDPGRDGVIRCVHSVLRQGFGDRRVRLVVPTDDTVTRLYGDHVHDGEWSPDQQARARAVLQLHRPLPRDALQGAMDLLVAHDLGCVRILAGGQLAATLTSTRARRRAARWRDRLPEAEAVGRLFGVGRLDVDAVPPRDDLGGYFRDAST